MAKKRYIPETTIRKLRGAKVVLQGQSQTIALIVCMGVSGCGKTTVARVIAGATGLRFFEADDFHSEENKALMASGKPLDDAMRDPWITRICDALDHEFESGNSCVLACSALRRLHRDRLREAGLRTCFLFLDGSHELIAGWMKQRTDHFMPPDLLESQFDALEPPENEPDVIKIALSQDWEAVNQAAITKARQFLSR